MEQIIESILEETGTMDRLQFEYLIEVETDDSLS